MATPWRQTRLSTNPPSHYMAETDRHALPFPAPFAVSSAATKLVSLPGLETVEGAIESATITTAPDLVTVLVSGLARGATYELIVTATAANGTTATGVLVIECVV